MKVLLKFLHHVLKMVTDVNLKFQQRSSKIYEVRPVITELLANLMRMFMTDEFFRLNGVDLENVTRRVTSEDIQKRWKGFHRKADHVNLGPPATTELDTASKGIPLKHLGPLKYACLRYLISLTSEIADRFDLSPSSDFAKFEFLNPAVDYTRFENLAPGREVLHLTNLHQLLGGKILTTDEVHKLDSEWSRFKLKKDDIVEKYFTEDDRKAPNYVTKFWFKVAKIESGLGKKQYEVLAKLALAALTVPHATAGVERVFSDVTRAKGRDANRMITVTLTGRLLASQMAKRDGCCVKYRPSQGLVSDIVNGQCRKRYFDDMRVRTDGKVRISPVTDQGWDDFEAEVEPEQFAIDASVEEFRVVVE
jgi:hypothetical protein